MSDSPGSFDALIASTDSRASLAVTRSLARHGISILLAADNPSNLSLYSRPAKPYVLGPSPRTDPDRFVAFILDTVRAHRIPLVIPITDKDVVAFERHRSALEAETRLAMPNSRAVRCVLNKRWNLELACDLGVPCPKQFELKTAEQVPEMIQYLGLPVVLKNPGPVFDGSPTSLKFRVLFAHSEDEVRKYLAERCPDGVCPLFQECAVGDVHNLCCFAASGELIAVHEYHSIRRYSGAGVLRAIVEPIPELVAHARKLLQALQWDGVAHLGFFLNKERNKTWYMETNGRFWASTEGSVYAGWDFPFWVYDYFRNHRLPQVGKIQLGSTTCWHTGDLLALAEYINGGDCPSTGAEHGKVMATLKYLSGFSPRIHSDVFRWNDPLPAVMENWQILKLAADRAEQFARSRLAPHRGASHRG